MKGGGIGFTGTQFGMKTAQKEAVEKILRSYKKKGGIFVSHGDCIGADEEFHEIAVIVDVDIIIHPPKIITKRAFCKTGFITMLPKYDYLTRNHHIVDESEYLIAASRSEKEQLRSGTWSTVRYARKKGKQIFIVYFNGKIEIEKNNE